MEEQKQPHWWGVSLAFDLKSCRQDFITNPEKLKLWIKDLVEEIEMEAYGDPQIVHFG